MNFHFRFTPRRLAVAIGTALVLSCVTAIGAETIHEVKDPHYGDTLFHFYQDHYFTALTNLMVSQHFGRVEHHGEEAEVLRGGILLSYGLLNEASEIFSRLIDTNSTPRTRDRAWYYLAKISYQRGYYAKAESALSRIGKALPADLQEDRGLLQANLMMARNDFASAAKVLSAMDADTASARYVRYNLGVALVRSGDAANGNTILDDLGRASSDNEEFRNLRDRANVALGFAALADNRPLAARNYLERVRLKGMESNKALLGLGWAAAAQKEPKFALVPWLELLQRDVSDSAVLEAQIAVPYAYAQLGAYGQSMNRYNEAINVFMREDSALTESIASIRSGKLINALVESNPGDEMGWFWSLRNMPNMPHANHLAHVMAQHAFQEAFKNYRDLRFLMKNLEEWRDKLAVFDDMLATRRKAFANRLPQVKERADERESEIDRLRKNHAVLTNEIVAAETAADGVAFADAKQRDLLERIESVQAALKDTANNEELAASRNRARLAAGALSWQLAQDYPARLWQAQKESQAIENELRIAKQLDDALKQAQRDEPARFDAFEKRIAALNPLLQELIPRVAAISQEQQQVVQDIAIAELTRQQERLAAYTIQARFAVAQLYDRGTDHPIDRPAERSPDNKEADRATKP
ncbi:MAG: hypothetical protein ACXWJK_07260 [Burkholderiaceae bacterium]